MAQLSLLRAALLIQVDQVKQAALVELQLMAGLQAVKAEPALLVME
jgi:hypothetical protein